MERFEDMNNQNSLDSKWYQRISGLTMEEYTSLDGPSDQRGQEERAFSSSEKENPDLTYPNLDLQQLSDREEQLISLKKEILEQEENEIIKQAYRWKINEMIASTRMLKCTINKDDRRFSKYSEFIYGKPSEEVFIYEIKKVKAKIEKNLNSKDIGKREAATELLDLIKWDNIDVENDEVKPVYVAEQVEKDESIITAEEAYEYFDVAIKKLNLVGWKVVVDETGQKTNFSTNQGTKEVIIPNNEQLLKRSVLLTQTKVLSLIAHELGVHALRRNNGERSKLQLLAVGLDRYQPGEEGLATFKEQQIEGLKDYAGGATHLAASLAAGIDGEKRDFRRVFEILKRINILSKKESVDRTELSSKAAWRQCVRIFRGTTCKTPGAILSKDIIYREGNIGIWNLINENSQEQHRFMVGKYDPTSLRHIYILDQLGISEKDLEVLE